MSPQRRKATNNNKKQNSDELPRPSGMEELYSEARHGKCSHQARGQVGHGMVQRHPPAGCWMGKWKMICPPSQIMEKNPAPRRSGPRESVFSHSRDLHLGVSGGTTTNDRGPKEEG